MGADKNTLRGFDKKSSAFSFINFSKLKFQLQLIIFFGTSFSLTAQNATLQLASNNKTIICIAGCSDGATGVLNGVTYTVYNNSSLASKSKSDTDWNRVVTTGVTNMRLLFKDSSFNQDISSWDTSSVSNMEGIFQNASSFNQDIAYWDLSSMTDQNGVNQMLDGAGALNQDLSYWCFPSGLPNSKLQNIVGNNNPIARNNAYKPRRNGGWSGVFNSNCKAAKVAPAPSNVDTTSPTLTITTPSGPKVSNSSLVVTLTYNEAVTGLTTDTSKFSEATNVANLQLLSASSDGRTYTLRITPQVEGLVKLTHAPGSPPVKDLAGNSIASTVSCSFTYDTTGPTVTLSDTDDDNLLASTDTVTITATFNEGMTATPTISISGTSISNQLMTKLIGGSSGSFTQLGGDIDGEAANDKSGASVSLSSDGTRVAIGAYANDGTSGNTNDNRGHVRIYDYNGSAWVQVGGDIDGEAAGDSSGQSVSLSSDGSRVAIGAIGNDGNGISSGHVRIYDYNGSAWVQVGGDIDGEAASDSSGQSVNLSSDGSRVAIGAPYNDGNGGSSGHVRIFNYNGSAWVQVGGDIDGEASGNYSGWNQVSLSSNGSMVAIGAYANDDNGYWSGHVRIFNYNGSAWVQVGADIDGEATNDQSGYSVSLSSDGSRVAIGATDNDGNGNNSGHVRVYDYNGTAWVQVGGDIDGEAEGDESGYSVSLSSDGSRVAIGARLNDTAGNFSATPANTNNAGHVRVYEYKVISGTGTWTQIGIDIDGEAGGDGLGEYPVSLSSDGKRVAIGATTNDGNGGSSGHVRVYEFIDESYQYVWDVDSGGAPSDGTYTVTVTGTDLAGNAYSGSENITFTLDTTAPTVTLTDTDSDNVVSTSEVVTITAGFSKTMTPTPTISITGIVTNVIMELVDYTVTDPVVFNVTVANSGGNKYFIDGQSQLSLVLVPGQTYRFDQSDSSNSGHPISFSTTNDGTHNSGSAYTTNVTSVGTPGQSGAYTLITIPSNGPSKLYYYCTNHSSMGGDINKGTGYYYRWDTSSGTLTTGNYAATVSGTDSIGNAYVAGTQSITFTVDTTSPTLTISTPSGPKFSNSSIVVTLTYNEAVTGLTTDTSKFSEATNVASLELLSASSDGKTYTLRINPTGEGLVKLTHAPGSPPVKDLAGNSIASTVSCSFTYDTSGPTVTFSDTDDDNFLAASDTVTITATFTEAINPAPRISITGVVTNVAMLRGGTVSFTAVDIATSASGPQSVFAADMDGDGDMDIVSASYGDDTIAWYENNGAADPTWTAADISTTADEARSVFAGDIDGDGDIDIVSASSNDDTIAWYENNGASDPSWTAADIATSADGAQSVYAADMDGDGDMDILSASFTDDTIAWYENNGAADPSWTAADIATDADGAFSVFAVDMDGDGDMDIISASSNDNTIAWYENNGASDPSWTASDIVTSADGAQSVYAADMDGDGDMDIISASYLDDTIAWYENNGAADPSWTAADIATDADGAYSVYAADIDGDGDMDIISASFNDDTIAWYENNGATDPSWTAADIVTSADGANSVFAADMDGDGDMDIVSASYGDDTIAWYENSGFSYNYTWNVSSTLSDGNYQVTVTGADLAGNAYSGTDSITFTLDNTAPTVTLTDTDSDNVVSTSEVVIITAGFSEAMTATPTISITGIVTNVIMTPVPGTNSYTFSWDTSSGTLTTGNYAATVSGTDLIGNAYVAGTQSITFTVDSSTPTVTITTNDSDNTIKPGDNITVTVTFNEPMASGPSITIGSAVSNVALTATSSTTFTYSWSTSGVSAGSYTVTVTGTDLAGNTYAGSDKITIKLDSTAPTVTLGDTDDDNFLAASDTVTITAFFNEAMTATPTISISGTSISDQRMIKGGGGIGSFTQLGQNIDGIGQDGHSGEAISFSSDGSIVAIGSPQRASGVVEIYGYTTLSGVSSWTQLGNAITGNGRYNDYAGKSVSLSSDGTRLAIGAYNYTGPNYIDSSRGQVRIFDYNGSADQDLDGNGQIDYWVQVGADILGEDNNDRLGRSVALSSDGSIVAIGATLGDGTSGNTSDNRGHVSVYQLQSGNWTQLGSDIDGEASGDQSGGEVAISSDGLRVAIGSAVNNGNGSESGHVRVYDYNGSAWVKVGADIDGEAAGDRSGGSISLSSDGSILAIGSPLNQGNGSNSGHVRIYKYTPSGVCSWTQLGADIEGKAVNEFFGSKNTISLSSNGSRIAIGAGSGNWNRGITRIYDYNSESDSWTQFGGDIDGEAAGDRSGDAVKLSSDGSIVAIAAPDNDGNGTDAGHVRVFSLNGDSYQYTWNVSSTLSDGNYQVTVTGADKAGNAYSGTNSITFTLDTTAPTIQSIYSSANGSYNQGDTVTLYLVADDTLTVDTSSGTPTISFDSSGTASYTTGSGTSSLTFTYTVGAGENSSDLNATAVSLNSGTIRDSIGNNLDLTLTSSGTTGALNANNDIVIDTTSPTLVITPPAGLKVTNSSVVTVTLTYSEPVTGLTTNVASYGTGTASVSSLKLISFTRSTTAVVEIYPSGEGTVKLVHSPGAPNVTDIAGNTIASTVSCSFTYDITPPSTPVSPTLSIASDSGPRDYITGIVTPTFEGTAEASSTIYLYDSSDLNTPLGTATAASNGSYSVTVSDTAALSEATYNFVVVAVDQAGNISSASSPTLVQVLTSAPPTPTVAPDLEEASDVGPSSTDNLTNVTTPTFSGTVTPSGLTVWLYQGSSAVASVTAANDGSYKISPTSALTSGDYVFTIKTQNAIGNFSGNSPPLNVSIQTTPQAPTAPTLKTETDLGTSDSDNVTSDSTPSIAGTVSPNTQVKLYVDGSLAETITSDASGGFEIDISVALQDDNGSGIKNEIYIELVDTYGNTATSTLLDLTIDTSAPSADPITTDKNIAASSTTTYTATGIAATDQVWLVPSTVSEADLKAYLANPSSVTSLTLGTNLTKQASGTTGTITTPSDGGVYKVVVVDQAGNFSSLSTGNLEVDLTAPTISSITQITSDGIYTDDDNTPSNSDTISITVTFDEPVTITGNPRIPLNITKSDGTTAYATYVSGSGTTTPTFVYTVEDGDITGGVELESGATDLDLNGGTIADVNSNTADTAFATNSVSLSTNIEVRATDPNLSVTLTSNNSVQATAAKAGDVITVEVTSDQSWPLDTSTISMTITGLSPQPTLSFSETSTSPYTFTANFTLTASNTYTNGSIGFSLEASDTVSSTKVTTPNKVTATQSVLTGPFTLDNTSPSITSATTGNVTEGTTTGPTVTASEQVTYSITGGADQSMVSINPSTGAITFNAAPDYENPDDADTDGVYEVEVTVTDIVGYTSSQIINITTDEVPFGIEFTVVEDSPTEGDNGSYTAVLTSAPAANVTIPLTTTGEGLNIIPSSVTFTPDNWNVPQTVEVYTSNNGTADGDKTATIATGVPVSSDTNYSSLAAADTEDFTITVVDDEVDTDGDGVFDYDDTFPTDPNETIDTDGDGIGNNTDPDDDNDGQSDTIEITNGTDPLVANAAPGDSDGDGIADLVDSDDDNDGVSDSLDLFPLDPNESADNDADGLGNNADPDDDNDGYEDEDEIAAGSDPFDASSVPEDSDNDLLPDLRVRHSPPRDRRA